MIRPLTKCKPDGTAYARPTEVETALEVALGLEPAELLRRASAADTNSAEFIRPECLVHIIRSAHREGNERLRDQVLAALFRRCRMILLATLPDSRIANARDLRDDVISELGKRFARDGSGEKPDLLDFFEIRFEDAFAKLRIDIVRPELRRARATVSLPVTDDGAEPTAHALAQAAQALHTETARLHDRARDLHAEIDALPLPLRDAAMLVHRLGFKIESEDPNELTASRICGVSSRTMRTRLKQAFDLLLQRFKEENQ